MTIQFEKLFEILYNPKTFKFNHVKGILRETPVLAVWENGSFHYNGIILFGAQDFENELRTWNNMTYALMVVNHEYLHWILWNYIGLKTPQGYDEYLAASGFYMFPAAWEWKIFPVNDTNGKGVKSNLKKDPLCKQINKKKNIFEQPITRVSDIFSEEGRRQWEEFKKKYPGVSRPENRKNLDDLKGQKKHKKQRKSKKTT